MLPQWSWTWGDDPADDVGAALATLPVVSVAVGAGGDSWDLALDDPGSVLDGMRANPQASVVAAQTLRLGARLDLSDGLLVESLAYAALQAGSEHSRWLSSRGRRTRRDLDQPRIDVSDDGASVTVTLNPAPPAQPVRRGHAGPTRRRSQDSGGRGRTTGRW